VEREGSQFPGRRRLVKTAGNALQQAEEPITNCGNSPELVAVTVPDSMTCGDILHVSAPDGSGRIVSAVIPNGMGPGSQFMVEFPINPPSSSASVASQNAYSQGGNLREPLHVLGAPDSNRSNINPAVFATSPDYSDVPIMPPPASIASPMLEPQQAVILVQVPPGTHPGSVLHVQVPGGNRMVAATVPPNVTEFHVAVPPLPMPSVTTPVQTHMSVPTPTGESALLNVCVPPGTPVGSTIYVQIPGEKRTIAATVPPHVTEFQVAYEKQVATQTSNGSIHHQQPKTILNNTTNREKLLKVKVPPGSAPGSTIHIQVPGEGGQVIAATVPHGVSEFHVSYQEQNQPETKSRDGHQANSGGSKNNTSSGMGYMAPMVAGGALMGVAGLALLEGHHG